jgi:hypothetical protein
MLPTGLLLRLLLLLLLGIRRAVYAHLVIAVRIRQLPHAPCLAVAAEATLAASPPVAEILKTAPPSLAVPVHDPSLRADADLYTALTGSHWLVCDGITHGVLAVGEAGHLVYTAAAGGVVMGHQALECTHVGGGFLGSELLIAGGVVLRVSATQVQVEYEDRESWEMSSEWG